MNCFNIMFFLVLTNLVACGIPVENPSWVDELIKRGSGPERVPGATDDLILNLSDLPLIGEAPDVWSGHWWPYSSGGLARKGPLGEKSPLERYDQVTNGSYLATEWELNQAGKLGAVSWAGHCNGLAAAGTMMAEPVRSVSYLGVDFSIVDIKALLVGLWQGGGEAVGGRCRLARPKSTVGGRRIDPDCRSLNPGTFHIVVSNFLGRMALPVIIDIDPKEQVWNYPIRSYEVTLIEFVSRVRADMLVSEEEDVWSSAATYFAHVMNEVTLATGKVISYEYVLEGDNDGNIIGGEWIRKSKKDHPDFIWRHQEPMPENPFLDRETILKIYQESIL